MVAEQNNGGEQEQSSAAPGEPAPTPRTNESWLTGLFGERPLERPDHLEGETVSVPWRGFEAPGAIQPIRIVVPAKLVHGIEVEAAEIIGVPPEATLTAGVERSPGTWSVEPADLISLAFVPAVEQGGFAELTVKVTGRDSESGETVSSMAGVKLRLPGTPPQPIEPAAEPTQTERPDQEETDEAPGPVRAPTGKIIVRLGGAPEQGAPVYRIEVDGAEVARGKLDWALGMPAVDGVDTAPVCWRDVEVTQDFSAGMPAEIRVAYDNDPDSDGPAECNLLVDFVEVDGVLLAAGGPYASYPGGRCPWTGDEAGERLMSWRGDAVFDVTSVADGVGPVLDVVSRERGAAPPGPGDLVVKASATDLRNPAVYVELAAVRQYLRGESDPRVDHGRTKSYADLGLDSGKWTDLTVLDPEGRPVDLEAGGPLQSSPRALGERLQRDLYAKTLHRALTSLGGAVSRGDAEAKIEPAPTPEPKLRLEPTSRVDAERIRQGFIAEALLVARKILDSAPLAPDAAVAADAVASTAEPSAPAADTLEPLLTGERVRTGFYRDTFLKALDKLNETAERRSAALPIPKEVAERMLKDYLDGAVRRGLERVEALLA